MFSQACVKNSVHGPGGCIPACTGADTPLPSACWDTPPRADLGRHPQGKHPPGQTPPLGRPPPLHRRPLQRTVRILLECILVSRLLTRFTLNASHRGLALLRDAFLFHPLHIHCLTQCLVV